MRIKTILPTLLFNIIVLGLLTSSAGATTPRLDGFYGQFAGKTAEGDLPGGEIRILSVTIAPLRSGFSIDWRSTSRWPDGRTRQREFKVEFSPASRAGLFESKMKSDMFGNRRPLDPLEGSPYVWAKLEGEALYVYSFRILENGGYEVEVHKRRLIADGLELEYRRVRDEQITKTLRATLARIR